MKTIMALLLCLSLAGIAALSVHVLMLGAGVPFPESTPPIWARWLNASGSVLAVLCFLRLAQPTLGDIRFLPRLLITLIVMLTIRETLRGAVMAGVVTSAWTFSFVSVLPSALTGLLVLALLCTIAMKWVRSNLTMFVAAFVIAALSFLLRPLTQQMFAPLTEHFASWSHDDLYQFPYPMIVMVPAYITFLEPVLGAAVVTALVWKHLPSGTMNRCSSLAALTAGINGSVIGTFLYSFFAKRSFPLEVLSYSQFLLEYLTLGFLTGLVWAQFSPRFDGGS